MNFRLGLFRKKKRPGSPAQASPGDDARRELGLKAALWLNDLLYGLAGWLNAWQSAGSAWRVRLWLGGLMLVIITYFTWATAGGIHTLMASLDKSPARLSGRSESVLFRTDSARGAGRASSSPESSSAGTSESSSAGFSTSTGSGDTVRHIKWIKVHQ